MMNTIYSSAVGALLMLVAATAFAQSESPAGKWKGRLVSNGATVEAKFDIKVQKSQAYTATLDLAIDGQTAFGIPASTCTYDSTAHSLQLVFAALGGLEFSGTQSGEVLKGRIGGKGEYDSITLQRIEIPASVAAGTPYAIDTVLIKNGKVRLAGIATHPWEAGKYPALVLVSGSGPQDRDETVFNHKPFAAIADYLSQRGVVVLRYDDRGVGASSGDFAAATTADFASDAEAAVQFARKLGYVDKQRVGVLGHSEGGIVAMMLAAEGKKKAPNFIVLMAAPGVPMQTILARQNEESMALLLQEGKKEELSALAKKLFSDLAEGTGDRASDSMRVAQYVTSALALAKPEIMQMLTQQGMTQEAMIAQNIAVMSTPWFRHMLRIDPATYLSRIMCSVLVLQGDRDRQVLAEENISAIRKGLSQAKNNRLMVKRYGDLNHLFVPCRTGSVQEYPMLNAPFSRQTLEDLAWWVSTR